MNRFAIPDSPVALRPGRWHPGAAAVPHSEVFASADDAAGAGFALALAAQVAGDSDDHRPWLWVQDKAAIRRSGRPCRAGLPRALRHRLIHVAANKPEDALFALEEGVRCRDLAFVLGEIAGNPAALDFTASRRLSLAAERHGVPLWLVRPGAKRDLGSARMRWQVTSAPGARPRWNGDAPGDPRWQAELFRAHVFQPGQWIVGHDERGEHLRVFAPDSGVVFAPDHGGLAAGSGDRPLAVAAGQA